MPRERLPFAGTFRAAATFAIVAYHTFLSYAGFRHIYPPSVLIVLGAFGVACFFALSGFLLGIPYAAAVLEGGALPSAFGFARDRFLRIYPLYAFLVIIIALLHLPNPGVANATIADVIRHLSFIFVMQPRWVLTIDPPMWTMAADVQFYVFLPLFFFAVAPLARWSGRPVATTGLFVLGCIAASAWWRLAHASLAQAALNDFGVKVVIFGQMPALFTAFGGGILGALIWVGTPKARRKAVGVVALAGAVPFAYYALSNLPAGVAPYIVVNDVLCGGAASLLLIAGCALLPSRYFESAPVMWAERLSYGVYLIHFFVVQRVFGWTNGLPVWTYFIVASLLSYAISCAIALPLYLFVERPFLILKSAINKRMEHYLQPAA